MSNFTFQEQQNIKRSIEKAGGLFYQYRACNKSCDTIYDIDNLMHGVVYARSPIYMNDPFDSAIGFSSEKIFDECIDLCLDIIDAGDVSKDLLALIIKSKMIGSLSDFAKALNLIKQKCKISIPKDLSQQQVNYFRHHIDAAIKALPLNLKKFIDKKKVKAVVAIILAIQSIEITDEELLNLVNADNMLQMLEEKIIEIRDNIYQESFRGFLSRLNISCFSSSGWDNQLMWSHYANSFSGICIEYDFTNLLGMLFYKVKYSKERPLISLKDFGIRKDNISATPVITDEITLKIINYLCTKYEKWNYEEEWR